MNRDKCLDIRLKVESNELIRTKGGVMKCRWSRLLETLGEAHHVHGLDPHNGASNLHMMGCCQTLINALSYKAEIDFRQSLKRLLTIRMLLAAIRILSVLPLWNKWHGKVFPSDSILSIRISRVELLNFRLWCYELKIEVILLSFTWRQVQGIKGKFTSWTLRPLSTFQAFCFSLILRNSEVGNMVNLVIDTTL